MIVALQITLLVALLGANALGWTFLLVGARHFVRRWGFPGVWRWATTPPGPIREDLSAIARVWRETLHVLHLRRRE